MNDCTCPVCQRNPYASPALARLSSALGAPLPPRGGAYLDARHSLVWGLDAEGAFNVFLLAGEGACSFTLTPKGATSDVRERVDVQTAAAWERIVACLTKDLPVIH